PRSGPPPHLPPFPTRRSSDLEPLTRLLADALGMEPAECEALQRLLRAKTRGNPLFFTQLLVDLRRSGLLEFDRAALAWTWDAETDRKSTRLNSSHDQISYAVF